MCSSCVFLQCTVINVTVSDICLVVYSDWIPCEEETAEVQQLLCVFIGATSIRRWITWKRDELEQLAWTCQNMMHAANTVSYNMANDESFNQEMKWWLGVACHTVSKQEDQNCTVSQQCYGILWIAHWLIFG